MKKRLLFLVTLLLLIGISITQVKSQNSLILRFNDGTEKSSALASLSKITFSGTNMILNYDNETTGIYDESLVKRMVFNVASGTGIETLLESGTQLAIYPNPACNYLSLKNAPDGELTVSVLRPDGAVLLSEKLSPKSQQIDISALARGFYLVKINNQTFKFMKL